MWDKGNIKEMFGRIASRYDRLNFVLSLNMDTGWRCRLVERAAWRGGERVLDLCTGTGDICVEFCRGRGAASVIGVDFSPGMLGRARKKLRVLGLEGRVWLVEADALNLPFSDEVFDIVFIGFGLRNLVDYRKGLDEIMRVLRSGGRLVILEATAPAGSLFGRLYRFYLRFLLPAAARVFGDASGGYGYFSSSVRGFVGREEVARWLRAAGFVNVRHESLSAGIAGLFTGGKPRR